MRAEGAQNSDDSMRLSLREVLYAEEKLEDPKPKIETYIMEQVIRNAER